MPAQQLAKAHHTSTILTTPGHIILTSINNSHINTRRLPRLLVHAPRPDLLPAQRILIRITARLNVVEKVMRHRDHRVVVARVYTAGAEAGVVVCELSGEFLGTAWEGKILRAPSISQQRCLVEVVLIVLLRPVQAPGKADDEC